MTGTAVVGDVEVSIEAYRLVVLMAGIKLYLRSGIRPARNVTPRVMRSVAGEYTGKTYPASRKGLETALDDLTNLRASLTN